MRTWYIDLARPTNTRSENESICLYFTIGSPESRKDVIDQACGRADPRVSLRVVAFLPMTPKSINLSIP